MGSRKRGGVCVWRETTKKNKRGAARHVMLLIGWGVFRESFLGILWAVSGIKMGGGIGFLTW